MYADYRILENRLNLCINEELLKSTDEVECETVEYCVDALLMMENDFSCLLSDEKVYANVNAIYKEAHAHPKKLSKTIKTILVAAVITLLLVISSLAYCRFRYDIINFTGHSSIVTDKLHGKTVSSLTVGYIPDGYVLYAEQKLDAVLSLEYRNNDKILLLDKASVFNSIDFDTECGSPREIERNGNTYIVSGNDEDWCIVIWFINGYRYSAEGNLPESEMLKVAETIE